MSTDPKTLTFTNEAVSEPAIDVPHAPFVYFEGVAASGFLPGMITATLVVGCVLPTDKGVAKTVQSVCAYLRCNRVAAVMLRDALTNALEASEPPQGPKQ